MPASRRVSPTERVRAQIDELFGSGRELGHVLEEVARLGVALLFQVASRRRSPSSWAATAVAAASVSTRPAKRLLGDHGQDILGPDHA